MTDTPDPKARRAIGWTRILLVVSLAANLGVAGFVGGAMLRYGPKGHPVPVRDLGFGPFSEALDGTDRDALRNAFMAQAPDFRASRREQRAEFANILDTLRAEPFEPAALRAVLERQNNRMADMLALGQSLIFDRIAGMTPEARGAFADRLETSLTHRPDRRKDLRKDRDAP